MKGPITKVQAWHDCVYGNNIQSSVWIITIARLLVLWVLFFFFFNMSNFKNFNSRRLEYPCWILLFNPFYYHAQSSCHLLFLEVFFSGLLIIDPLFCFKNPTLSCVSLKTYSWSGDADQNIDRHRLPRWLSSKESIHQCRRHWFDPYDGKIPWRRKWQSTPVFLPEESMDRGDWWATVHSAMKSQMTESN